jgi:hypothetical protein
MHTIALFIHIIYKIKQMGNSHNDPEEFNPRDWVEVPQPNNRITLWQNKNNRNYHLEEHKIYTLDSQ